MYRSTLRAQGISRKTRDMMLILLGLLLVGNIVQFALGLSSTGRDAQLRNVLVSRVKSDVSNALNISSQLSRTGGSNTQRFLGEIRQYLYGATQLNEMTNSLYGNGQMLVPQTTIDNAIRAVDECESRRQEGLALDTPLTELWQLMNELAMAAEALS